MNGRGVAVAALSILIALLAVAAGPIAPSLRSIVARGLSGEIFIEHAGTLRAKPEQGITSPILVRVTDVSEPSTAEGAPRRWRIDFIGAVAGDYDLRDLIQDADGRPLASLAPLSVRIVSELPAQHGTDLFSSAREPFSLKSHYRLLMALLVLLWLAIPALVLLRRWMRRPRPVIAEPVAPPPTLAEQLRPLVEAARRGELSIAERGRLELLLLSFWRARLALDGLAPAEAIPQMRIHPEAGRLLVTVEEWLHARRDASAKQEPSVKELLAPYGEASARP